MLYRPLNLSFSFFTFHFPSCHKYDIKQEGLEKKNMNEAFVFFFLFLSRNMFFIVIVLPTYIETIWWIHLLSTKNKVMHIW